MLLGKTISWIRNDSLRRNASQLAFIGIGNMGSQMVTNLIKKGESVRIYDISSSNAESIQGATICKSPAEAAQNASLIITMLPHGKAVEEAILGTKGVLESASKNSLLIDCSTIEPQTAINVSEAVNQQQIRFVDAPVSGGVTGAAAGTLTFMVGGNKKDFQEAEPVLLKMGSRVFHCGNVGAGQTTKLCNNLILAVTMVGTAEGMNLGIKMGLDPKVLNSVVTVSTGRSWSSDTYNPVPGIIENTPAGRDYEGGFAVKLLTKDLGLVDDMAKSCDATIPLGALTNQLYKVLKANGLAEKDFGVIYKFLKGQ